MEERRRRLSTEWRKCKMKFKFKFLIKEERRWRLSIEGRNNGGLVLIKEERNEDKAKGKKCKMKFKFKFMKNHIITPKENFIILKSLVVKIKF